MKFTTDMGLYHGCVCFFFQPQEIDIKYEINKFVCVILGLDDNKQEHWQIFLQGGAHYLYAK